MLENSLIIIEWIFFAYMLYRIGNRLNIKKSYPWYIIPLWNFWILGKHSEMKIKNFSLIFVGTLVMVSIFALFLIHTSDSAITIIGGADGATSLFIANRLAPDILLIFIMIIFLFIRLFVIIFWGSVAKKIGKEQGAYVVFGLFSIYLPPLLLAFEKIDKLITTDTLSNMYSPLSVEEEEALSQEDSIPKNRINRAVSIGVLLLILLSIFYAVNSY